MVKVFEPVKFQPLFVVLSDLFFHGKPPVGFVVGSLSTQSVGYAKVPEIFEYADKKVDSGFFVHILYDSFASALKLDHEGVLGLILEIIRCCFQKVSHAGI
jgi:hypothetical protein